MADVRIKDLASAEKQLDNFDEFEFIADVPDVDASMKLSGKQLREKITPSKHTHPVKGKVDFPQIGFEKGTTERGVSKVSKSC